MINESQSTLLAAASPFEYASLPEVTSLSVAAVISQGSAGQIAAASAISFLS